MKKSSQASVIFSLVFVLMMSSCATVYKNGYYQTKRYKMNHKTSKVLVKNNKMLDDSKNIQISEKLASNQPNFFSTEDAQIEMQSVAPLNFLNFENNTVAPAHFSRAEKKELKKAVKAFLKEIKSNNESSQDSCDLIVFRNGEEEWAQVMEISKSEVRYKRCSNLDGPTRVAAYKDVLFIRYKNGEKEIFKIEQEVVSNNNNDYESRNYEYYPENKSSGAGVTAFGIILIILGGLVTLFISILIGLVLIALGIILVSIGST